MHRQSFAGSKRAKLRFGGSLSVTEDKKISSSLTQTISHVSLFSLYFIHYKSNRTSQIFTLKNELQARTFKIPLYAPQRISRSAHPFAGQFGLCRKLITMGWVWPQHVNRMTDPIQILFKTALTHHSSYSCFLASQQDRSANQYSSINITSARHGRMTHSLNKISRITHEKENRLSYCIGSCSRFSLYNGVTQYERQVESSRRP